jgi:hypothetical protein
MRRGLVRRESGQFYKLTGIDFERAKERAAYGIPMSTLTADEIEKKKHERRREEVGRMRTTASEEKLT